MKTFLYGKLKVVHFLNETTFFYGYLSHQKIIKYLRKILFLVKSFTHMT